VGATIAIATPCSRPAVAATRPSRPPRQQRLQPATTACARACASTASGCSAATSRASKPALTRATLEAISPFFIVGDVGRSVAFYRDRLGFETTFQEPSADPFFAILRRDGAQLFIKHFDAATPALPNPQRNPGAKWDAFVHAPDPDALAEAFAARGAAFKTPLGHTSDGLRGFEIADPDGHVLFFGRARG